MREFESRSANDIGRDEMVSVSPSRVGMTDWEGMWIRSLAKPPTCRSLQDLQVIYYGLSGLEALQTLRDSSLRALCKIVRYEKHLANDVLYYTGELSTCWYILLSGSVFIDGSMFLPRSSFGKRTGGSARRQNECFVLEPSEMIVIDYPDIEPRRIQNSPLMDHPQHRSINIMFEDAYAQNIPRQNLYHKCSRGSHSSDTSSAYSGSDTMASTHSELEGDELDLTGLVESIVDSDEEDDLTESMDSLTVRDRVRDCLEKEPAERTEDDIEALLEFTQHLKAFTNMTLAVRRALCAVMVFAVVEKSNTVVMNDGEELDSWSVLVNGSVEVVIQDGPSQTLYMGDAFGILPTMDKLYHKGIMITKCDDCQFVCITQSDYYRILHQGEENTRRHEEDGKLVMVTELRGSMDPGSNRRGHVVIRATAERLMQQLIEENSVTDPTYVEDFLLTHRVFIKSPLYVANQLLDWFKDPDVRDRVTRVVLLWVNNHFTDFETDPDMIDFLETFEQGLETEKMSGQLRLLNIACAAKARIRNVVLARPNRDEPLSFQILGGFERNFGIFISKVDKKSKAEDVGLKRGDQILEVNNHSFEHMSLSRALEILKGTTHLSITVKSNLLNFKEMLNIPDNSPRPRGRKVSEITKLPPDPRARLSSVDGNIILSHDTPASQPVTINSPAKGGKKQSFMTLGRLQKALMKMSIFPKNMINVGLGQDEVDSFNPPSTLGSNLYQSQSNPDLMSICYDDLRCTDYPEHVLKVYKPDQSYKYLLVHKETTAHEVVMLALQEFGMTDPSSNFSLCEVSVTDNQTIKQKRLQDDLQNLAERIGLSSRYYLKTNGVTETLVPDELAPELVRESAVHFLQLNAVEVAIQLTLLDFSIFRQIEPTEYIDDLFELKSKYGTPMLEQFASLVNKETFWVVSEVCSEHNPVRRMKIIKQFIKVARQCKECKNFNSMFAIISGLGHGAVSRLRQSWDKLPGKYQRVFAELQQLMDPSRNMSKYRQLVSAEQTQPPIIPFYPIVKKDLTFIHLGNDSKVEGLINFEKLRMIAKEVRSLSNMCSSPYDLLTMLKLGGQPASNAMVALNQLTTASTHYHTQGQATVKRRKKSTAAPNPKKMFEESQMVRRVKAYLNNLQVETDETKLHEMSLECEGPATGSSSAPGIQRTKRHSSPAPSTTSSTSSASDERKPTAKFGSASPQAVRKLLALSEPNKTRPHQPRLPSHGLSQPSPAVRRAPSATGSYSSYGSHSSNSSGNGGRAMHERSHSDTPTPLPSVALSAESSSVTSLSNLPLRKTVTSGSVSSSDSGHSTISQVTSSSNDCHSYQQRCSSPPRHPPPIPGPGRRQPPAYSVAAQMARLHRLGRAHSHEGVTQGYHYHTDPDTDQDDEETQVSAV
ncbi:rap guanine nucleotide exchange factor 6-like isoform X3 [Diorhabda carinulata]|uniref:rap guanine nucleotide exchange factor 6-like isoform X3 n=1 Tax=Diorhabda carinulata TaxID=1163345 RepID=UPI0025A30FAD|nr:rap guanine nucleotide exchange factor 6-like isoform X3 [Diorhabda carinulata]XP_057661273.1 rap guanine nucleotide exchange factor 6-like isoform X3 [Diorhabda carinulata]